MTRPTQTGLSLDTDVMVLGGGPAGAWAAISAAEAGARVVLADKGYLGTSGAAASGGNNLWYLPEDESLRARAVADREALGGRLTDRRWMERVQTETYRQINRLAEWGYPFPRDEHGNERRSSLQGPEYMRRLRRKVHRSGVHILDHHPALELLTDADGTVSGAAGLRRQEGWTRWQARAGAVVLATGGCAFLSGAFGLNVDTGDGHLMAAELGAELSGMEFSSVYGRSPAFGNHTKGLMMQFASYYDASGRPLEAEGHKGAELIARRLAAGRPVHARLDRAPTALRQSMRQAQPNYFLPLDKAGVDPFDEAYPLRLVFEGTVRGTGGLRLLTPDCATGVPGLYAAGDVATRELVTGAASGGGSLNGAWAISSGTWAGGGAARFARNRGALPPRHNLRPAGTTALRAAPPGGHPTTRAEVDETVTTVQKEVLPLDRNYFRTADRLHTSLRTLDTLWGRLADQPAATDGRTMLRAREAAAMTAHARWMYRAALAREESRGVHRRDDRPGTAARFEHRLMVSGLEQLDVRADPVLPVLTAKGTRAARIAAGDASQERRVS
ncbi:FAD-dependent oxidoreductase [Streptomyces brasiliensis]|uniref:Pyridine nucleotide-disulfide oxidoreductase n=1 Tax=Streptomyces brasiliensis TaxID=1954 RepID=A0A917PC82_9ACTN|nr:FAD-binding protein [Streptomyces brasiliensis]GGJ70626.1 pyridine nucleotide-disulfide oxidoreductase [Streptomyces brasiliensis]